MNQKRIHTLAQELWQLDVEKERISEREKDIKKMLDAELDANDTVSVDRGKHYLIKIVSYVPSLVDLLLIYKALGIRRFLNVIRVSVELLREEVGEETMVAKFVKRYSKTTSWKFFEYGEAEQKRRAA